MNVIERQKQATLDFVSQHLDTAQREGSFGKIQISIQNGSPEMASVQWSERMSDATFNGK